MGPEAVQTAALRWHPVVGIPHVGKKGRSLLFQQVVGKRCRGVLSTPSLPTGVSGLCSF